MEPLKNQGDPENVLLSKYIDFDSEAEQDLNNLVI